VVIYVLKLKFITQKHMDKESCVEHFVSSFIIALTLTLVCYLQPDVVVNCAAISVPRACEIDPASAHAINVPSSLVKWLQSFKQNSTLLIHLSTDQGKPV
jgi:dTDP-4-dehydrorhamnose reductase